jgi:hypothetical protein
VGHFYTCAGLRYSLCAVNVPLVLRKAKAVAPASHAYHLAHGLQLVLNSSGHSDLAALYADAIAGGAAWEAILAQLTIGEIYFPKPSAARRPQAAHLPRDPGAPGKHPKPTNLECRLRHR